MADGDKKSSIVNIIIMVLIVVINVVVVFFVSKIVIKKSIESVVAEQSAILQQAQAKNDDSKPKRSKNSSDNEDDEYYDEEDGGENSNNNDDMLKNYNSADYENYPMEEIYANIEGRYLVITLNLKFSKEEKKLGETLKTAEPDIRAEVLSLLRREAIENLEDVNYERELQNKIKKRINKLLPEGKISYVMFTQYLIQ